MSKKNCSDGNKWDNLLQTCVPLDFEKRHPAVTEASSTPPADQTAFSPALWIVVLLVTVGSILALALWLVIYRRHSRQHTVEEPGEQLLHKTDPSVTVHCLLPSEASPPGLQHLNPERPSAPVWQGDTHREQTGHDGGDWGAGLHGSAVRQETVPLPATELGGTALVTTKTL